MKPMPKQRAPTPYFTAPGFTLIEAGIALAVIGLVVGGIWVAGNKAQTSVQVTTLAEQVHQIVDNLRGLYVSQRGIFTDNTQATVNGAACGAANFNSRLSCLGAYPADMAAGGPGGAAFHSFDQARAGGSVVILPRDINFGTPGVAPGGDSFGVQVWNVPLDVCITLTSQHSAPDQKYNLRAVLFLDNASTVLTNYVTASRPPDWTLGGTRANTLPITPTQAAAACNGAMAIEWIFSLR